MTAQEIEALTLSRDEWKARAIAAETGVQRREDLLSALSAEHTNSGRVRMAVVVYVDGEKSAFAIHGNAGDETEMLNRWAESIAPYVRLLTLAVQAKKGKNAAAAIERSPRAP